MNYILFRIEGIFLDTNEFKESKIRQSLNTSLKAKLDDLNQKVRPVLSRTTNTLINFTDHSLEHSLGVENAYDILLDGQYELLTEEEKFLLIAATILHDIGMVGKKEDLENQDYEKFRRDAHNNYSKEIIIQESTVLNLDFTEAKLIADIAEAHRKVPLDSLEEEMPYGLGNTVRLRLLGALLRFADELHVTKGRTSHLLMNILSPDEFSMSHHKRHENVNGVSRLSSNRETIVISANADDWEMENLMNEMLDEISRKHKEVNDILAKNKIIVNEVRLDLRCEDLITKEIFLSLAEKACSEKELVTRLEKRDATLVRKVLAILHVKGLIKMDTSNGELNLQKDEKTLKTIFNSLKGTDYIYKFIDMPYLIESIGQIFDEIALRVYSHRVFNGDREDRLLLVRNSPIVLDYLLNKQEMDTNFAQLDRSVVLDLLILNGFMQDVTKKPALSKDDETVLAMQNIQNTLHKELGPFLSLVQHLEATKLEQGKLQLQQQIEKKN